MLGPAPIDVAASLVANATQTNPAPIPLTTIEYGVLPQDTFQGRTAAFTVRINLNPSVGVFLATPQVSVQGQTSWFWTPTVISGGAGQSWVTVLVSPTGFQRPLDDQFSLILTNGNNGIGVYPIFATAAAPLTVDVTVADPSLGIVLDHMGPDAIARLAGANCISSTPPSNAIVVGEYGTGSLTDRSTMVLCQGAQVSVANDTAVAGGAILLPESGTTSLSLPTTTGLVITTQHPGGELGFVALPIGSNSKIIPVLTAGSATLAPSSNGLAFSIDAAANTLVTTGDNQFQANASVNSDSSITLEVLNSSAILSIGAQNGAARSFNISQGDSLTFAANGQLSAANVVSSSMGAALSTFTLPSGMSFSTPLVQLGGASPHLAGARADDKLSQAVSALLGTSVSNNGEDAIGDVMLGLGSSHILAAGNAVTMDLVSPPAKWLSNGDLKLGLGGPLYVELTPGVSNAPSFMSVLTQLLGANTTANRIANGTFVITQGGNVYAGRPAWVVSPSTAKAGMIPIDGRSLLVNDGAGYSQVLYGAFANVAQLQAVLKSVDANAIALIQTDATANVTLLGHGYRFLPNWALITTPVAHKSDQYWVQNGQVFLNNQDGTSQGFTIQ